jgi:hypothetical protein
MDSVPFNYGVFLQKILDDEVTGPGLSGDVFLRLSASSVPLSPNDPDSSNYSEPTLPGYTPLQLGGATWTLNVADGTATTTYFGPSSWAFGANAGTTTLHGFWLENFAAGTIMWAGNFAVPYNVPATASAFSIDNLANVLGTCPYPPPPPPPPPPLLVVAPFAAPDGTAIGSYTPPIGPNATTFTSVGTLNAYILGDTLQMAASAPAYSLLSFDVGQSDITLSAGMRGRNNPTFTGLFGRAVDPTNFYEVDIAQNGGTMRIRHYVAGVSTTVATVSLGLGEATNHLEVHFSGDTITAVAAGAVSLTYGSATASTTATVCGVFMSNATGAGSTTVTNLIITTP